jgi:hypothetical protein
VKNADPELALAAIEFWDQFIVIENIVIKEDIKKKIFD